MDEELNSSKLGSHEYWNEVYEDEINNFKNHGDVGEIWFGKETARRVVKWICDNPNIQKNDAILDLGCGNGMLLMDLFQKGFNNLHGVDYSPNAIELASAICKTKQFSINFFSGDILNYSFETTYSVILDKGTYDAISLSAEDSKSKRLTYIERVFDILKENGYFILTSCNWTQTEILSHFKDFTYLETLPAPSFQFGGKSGNTVTTVVFSKKPR